MPSSEDIRKQAWAKEAPDYFVEGVCIVVEARDEIRQMMRSLNEQSSHINEREQKVIDAAQVLSEREEALLKAAEDIKAFANRTYGPDSELSRINRRLIQVDEHAEKIGKIEERLDLLERRTGTSG